MLVLCILTAGIASVRVAPHDNLTDLVQYAVCFIEVPASLLTTHVREVPLQEVQQQGLDPCNCQPCPLFAKRYFKPSKKKVGAADA